MKYVKKKYTINQIVRNRKITGYRDGIYTMVCQKCGVTYSSSVYSVNRDYCICRLDAKTSNIKNKIGLILEMYFGLGMSINDISKEVGIENSGVSHHINHGFKKKDGITITLQSKMNYD